MKQLTDEFRERNITTLMNQLIDAKKHNFCNYYIVQKICYIVVELMTQNKDVCKLIQSDDQEIFYLGSQMLFNDYLDQYNELCENPKWEQLVLDTIKNYKYYVVI